MYTHVGEMAEALGEFVSGLDVDSVPLNEAPGLWQTLTRIERLAAGARTLLARRVDDSGVWRRSGHASAAEYLAGTAGESVGSARSQLETSNRLKDLDATADAVRSGSLSPAQTASIADAARVNAGSEADLLDLAQRSSLSDLRTQAARAKAAATDAEDAYRRIHRQRRLRTWHDSEGAWNLVARGPVDAGAAVMAALEPFIDQAFHDARAAGEPESREAYAFDALVVLAKTPGTDAGDYQSPPAVRHLALLRVDLEALIRGSTTGDECCEIGGLGPVPVSRARDLLGESVLKLVITRGTDVANVTSLGRGPKAAQRVALLWSAPSCSVAGCNRRRVQIDHRIPWAQTHHTRLDELDPLCGPHHRLKTTEGWALAHGKGKRPLVPPDDPRHPAHGPPERLATSSR